MAESPKPSAGKSSAGTSKAAAPASPAAPAKGAKAAPAKPAPAPAEPADTKAPAKALEPAPAAAAHPAVHGEHKTHSFRRRLLGKVVSNKMQKTVVVEVVRRSRDTVYKKYVRNHFRYKAHDEKNEYKVGDRVEIIEHRPLSKEKRWKVVRLVSRAVEE